ncbi:hypothetical protein Mal4_42290 [Maioricimonas rarisocia]|uniref:DMSO reductase anchor subunit (DmsC) n=1 Tax=Maioricimonas rarisocia TaxID=2528026 RepID=A0A517ZBL0_9PLAN|nr:hypothetical protein [Maioricimonas rarisocia]QDU39876.1 hypothetical protein Mal4_42290 [Maioricimonas rarisocia]
MIAQITLRLVAGMSLTWCLMPRRDVTSGYFRIQMLAVLGLSTLAALTIPAGDTEAATLLGSGWLQGLSIAAAVTSFVGSVLWTLERRQAGTVMAFVVALLAAGSVIGFLPHRYAEPSAESTHASMSALSSAWVIGGSVSTMLLGHWYLTATSMSTEPLKRLNTILGLAVIVRGGMALYGLSLIPAADLGPVEWTWLTVRWLGGLIGLLVLTVLTARILQYRNTQSATGVLFAAVILAFMGEATGLLLARELHVPL